MSENKKFGILRVVGTVLVALTIFALCANMMNIIFTLEMINKYPSCPFVGRSFYM